MPELRRDPIVGRWVIIATERARRPAHVLPSIDDPPEGGLCPFCPGQESRTPPEILAYRPFEGAGSRPNTPGWSLRVFPNRHPALKIEGGLDRAADGMYDRMNGVGAHEVLVETPDHRKHFAELTHAEAEYVCGAWCDRMVDLSRDGRLRYVMVFKNYRAAAGATLAHGHSQLIALPTVPMNVTDELEGSLAYFRFKERCVFCDMIDQERRAGAAGRLVYENAGFVAIAPWASRFPFETWVLPKIHRAVYEATPRSDYGLLADALQHALKRLRRALDDPPYNFILHTAPLREPDLAHYHWHVEIIPKLSQVAGFEWGSGFFINPTSPEEAARFLRELPE